MLPFAEATHAAQTANSFITDLLVISSVAIWVRFVQLPYTIALVAAGLLIGLAHHQFGIGRTLQLTPDLLFIILLPALLFEASIHLDANLLKKRALTIALLAVPGLLLSTACMGYGLHALIPNFALPAALVFGALISATDPVSVLALFKSARVDPELALMVEGESLFNDGTAVVMYNLLVASALGSAASLSQGAGLFVLEAGGGLVIGSALGWLCWKVIEQFDDHLIEITLSTLLAYGSYLLATNLHVSGVIAVIAAGIVFGNHAIPCAMSNNTRLLLLGFWEYLAFLANSLVFLLIGTQVDLSQLVTQAGPILIAFLLLLATRALMVALVAPFTRLSLSWNLVLTWGGVRGSIAMALALGLTLPERDQLLLITFGVVLLSLFVQGLTMKPLIASLKLAARPSNLLEHELTLGELVATEAALRELEAQQHRFHLAPAAQKDCIRQLEERAEQLRLQLEAATAAHPEVLEEQARDARTLVRNARLVALREAVAAGVLSAEANAVLSERFAALDPHEAEPPLVRVSEKFPAT